MPQPDRAMGGSAPARPLPVKIAVALVYVEAAALLAFTVWFALDVFPVGRPVPTRLAMVLGVIVFLLVVVASLAAAARALLDLRHWPRSLLVVLQIIALALGFPFARGGLLVGWFISACAVAVLVALLTPATTAAIEQR